MVNSFLEEMNAMQARMDAMFDRLGQMNAPSFSLDVPLMEHRHSVFPPMRMMRPLSNMWENQKEVGLDLDMPGLEKKDIDLKILPDRLEVHAQKKHEAKEKGENMFRMERSFAGFSRSFPLPHPINPTKASATYSNGVLHIRLPKQPGKKDAIKRLRVE